MEYLKESNIKKTYYEVLGLESSANDSEIRLAYRSSLLNTHPDKVGNRTNDEGIDITLIKEAYETLIDPKNREKYDSSLKISMQRQGFNINGDGLDSYFLEEFEIVEDGNDVKFYRDCPRCEFPRSIYFSEDDLVENGTEDGEGGFDIVVQCDSCSLWIRIKYYEDNDS